MARNNNDGCFNRPLEPYFYLAPFIIGVILWTLYPVINVFLISFKENYRFLSGNFSGYGLANYARILNDPHFLSAIKNTAIYVAIVVPISTSLSVIIATLLNNKIKGMAIFQTAFFLPLVTSATAVGLVWKLMFNTNFGAINNILKLLNLSPIHWLDHSNMNIYALIIFGIWNIMPFTIILVLSGLQNIDPMYYTVAKVDGAKTAKIFFRITLPLLAPTIGLILIINTISLSKVYTELFTLFNGSPGATYNLYTVVFYIYDRFYVKDQLAIASAASVILFLILFILTMLQLAIQRRWKRY